MEIAELLYIVRKRILFILLFVAVTTGAVYYKLDRSPASYQASTIVTIQAKRENVDQYQYGGYYAIQSSELFVNTVIGWVKSPNIVGEIYKNAAIEIAPEKLAKAGKNIYARKVPPQNISLIITNENREQATNIAQATIELIQDRTAALSQIADASANFEVISTPLITVEAEKNVPIKTVAAGIIMALLACLLVFAREILSKTINTPYFAARVFHSPQVKIARNFIKISYPYNTKLKEKIFYLLTHLSKKDRVARLIISDAHRGVHASVLALQIARVQHDQGLKTAIIDLTKKASGIYGKKSEHMTQTVMTADASEKSIAKLVHSERGIQLFSLPADSEKIAFKQDQIAQYTETLSEYFDTVICIIPPINKESQYTFVFQIIKQALTITLLHQTAIKDAQYIDTFMQDREVDHTVLTLA